MQLTIDKYGNGTHVHAWVVHECSYIIAIAIK